MGLTAAEVERFTWKEFTEWEIYLASTPTAAEVVDWQFATLLSLLSGVFGGPASARRPVAWSIYERMRPRTAEEIAADVRREFGV